MTDFVIKQLPYDLSHQAGLALIGKYLKRINLNALVDPAFPVRSGAVSYTHLDVYKRQVQNLGVRSRCCKTNDQTYKQLPEHTQLSQTRALFP